METKRNLPTKPIPSAMECSTCLDAFDDPRVLPCGHTFCQRCITRTLQATKTQPPTCSLCRKEWQVPSEGGAAALPKNYVASSFKDSVPATVQCVLADGDDLEHGPVEYFCTNCWHALCGGCRDAHRRNTVTRSHVIRPIRELSNEDVAEHRRQAAAMCNVHKGQEVVVYCKECRDVACTVCCVTTHSKHDCIELHKADHEFTQVIKKSLIASMAIHTHNAEQIGHFKESHERVKVYQKALAIEVQESVNKTKATLKQAFDRVIQSIDEIERQSLAIIFDNTNAKFETEYANIKQLEMHISQCEHLLQPTSSAVERARLVKQILTLPAAHKCELIEKKVQQCMTVAVNVTKTLPASFTISPIPKSLFPVITDLVASHEMPWYVEYSKDYVICIGKNMIACRSTSSINRSSICIYDFPLKMSIRPSEFAHNFGWCVRGVFASNGNLVVCLITNGVITVSVMALDGKVVAQSPFNNVTMRSLGNKLSLTCSVNGDIILAIEGAIFKSRDNGQTWKQVLVTSNPASDEFQFDWVIAVNQSKRPLSVTEYEEIYWVHSNGTNGRCKTWEYTVDVSQMKVTKRLEIDTSANDMQTFWFMAYDGDDSMFVTCGSSVHIYSVINRSYLCNLNIAIDYYGDRIYVDAIEKQLIVATREYVRVYDYARTDF